VFELKIPEVGENIKSGTIVAINVKVGDQIKKGQDILEMETDKASLPIPSSTDGVVKEILIKAGQEVKIGQVVMNIEAGATASASSSKPSAPEPAKPAAAPVKEEPKTASKPEPVAVSNVSPIAPVASSHPAKDVAAAPSVRRFAREIGIDVSQVPGTGPSGRISLEDVKAYAKALNTSRPSGSGGTSLASRALPAFSTFGTLDRQPMNNIRKKPAEHLSYAWQAIPHVTQFGKADITELEKLRKKYTTPERGLTITPFLMKVMASALKQFPQFNASIDMERNEIIYKKYFNIGVAVDTERGLIVPVIRDVEKKNIFQIVDDLKDVAKRAREKRVTLEEMQGGSITLTNLGGIGGTSFTPIVNWPEVAILGVSRGGWEQTYENGQFVPRFKLPLSLSYDHRIIDGADGARFLNWICEAIEQPFMMELSG